MANLYWPLRNCANIHDDFGVVVQPRASLMNKVGNRASGAPDDTDHEAAPTTRVEAGRSTSPSRSRAGVNRVSSKELFADAVEVEIDHEGETYRLRRTSRGKLILTK